MGRPSRRMPCSSGRAPGPRSSRRPGSSTCSTCGARTERTSTGCARSHPEPLVPLERCFGVDERIGADGRPPAARPRVAPRRSMRRPLRSACSSRSAIRVTRRRLPRSCGVGFPARKSSPRTRSRPSSGSTSGRRRPRSTRTSARAGGVSRARSRLAVAEAGLPEPLVMRSSGGRHVDRRSRGASGVRALSGPGGRSGRGRGRGARGRDRKRGLLRHGRNVDRRRPDRRRRGSSTAPSGSRRRLSRSAAELDIQTVGAGGGSIAWRDEGGALRVGPRAPAQTPGLPVMDGAGLDPRSRTRTSSSGGCRRELAGGVGLDRAGGRAGARRSRSCGGGRRSERRDDEGPCGS